jgi:hypothetical protein
MRISTTTLESYRLWRQDDQDWMAEDDLIASIKGLWVPTHKAELGTAFGKILEDPDRYLVPGGFECRGFGFDRDVIEPCLSVIDRRGVFEAKGVRTYDGLDVVAKADQLLGTELKEFKTTLGTFDADKYLESYQWRYMADIFQPSMITYHVFCLFESEQNGVIELRSIESVNLYPYDGVHEDCVALVRDFAQYVTVRGLDGLLRERQRVAV